MTWIEIFALAAALAMDAFSVSVSSGMSDNCTAPNAVKMSLMFGFFQFIMPFVGNGTSLFFAEYTRRFSPFIVFAVLTFIGVRMILGYFNDNNALPHNPFRLSSLTALAFATSIDALAAGISIGSSGAPVLITSLAIGIVAAVLSAAGLCAGHFAKRLICLPAEILGGIILIVIAVKSLLEFFI